MYATPKEKVKKKSTKYYDIFILSYIKNVLCIVWYMYVKPIGYFFK